MRAETGYMIISYIACLRREAETRLSRSQKAQIIEYLQGDSELVESMPFHLAATCLLPSCWETLCADTGSDMSWKLPSLFPKRGCAAMNVADHGRWVAFGSRKSS